MIFLLLLGIGYMLIYISLYDITLGLFSAFEIIATNYFSNNIINTARRKTL